jgi:hypothetical protein
VILCNARKEPIVFTIEIGDEWSVQGRHAIKGHLTLLNEPTIVSTAYGEIVRDNPIVVAFVPTEVEEAMSTRYSDG